MEDYKDRVDWDNSEDVEDLFLEQEIRTYDQFFFREDFDVFEQEYTSPSGDKIVGFGYYGYD